MDEEIKARLLADVERIRAARDRTGSLSLKPLRWEGTEHNPNGWRLMGDLADDIEALIKELGHEVATAEDGQVYRPDA